MNFRTLCHPALFILLNSSHLFLCSRLQNRFVLHICRKQTGPLIRASCQHCDSTISSNSFYVTKWGMGWSLQYADILFASLLYDFSKVKGEKTYCKTSHSYNHKWFFLFFNVNNLLPSMFLIKKSFLPKWKKLLCIVVLNCMDIWNM